MGVSPANWLQFLMIILLVAGTVSGEAGISAVAVALAAISVLIQWGRLLGLARLFVLVAIAATVIIATVYPRALPLLAKALVQGASFAALMMVLGMLRHPVRRSVTVRHAVKYLLSFRPRNRYAAINIGAHFLSVLFNVGMIAMIGDLTGSKSGKDNAADSSRRSLVVGSMRGTALVSIWSPIGLGFAIVTAGIPSLDAMRFLCLAFLFTLAVPGVASFVPLLPQETSIPASDKTVVSRLSPKLLAVALAVCALLLILKIGMSSWIGISITMASVALLPMCSAVWIVLEKASTAHGARHEIWQTLSRLSDLRTESAMFMSANVIRAAISIGIRGPPIWDSIRAAHQSILPVLLFCLAGIPLAAMMFIPNSIALVMMAQLLGTSAIGMEHPITPALTLSIGWAALICVSPISAMSLVTGSLYGVTSRRVAHNSNRGFVLTLLGMAAVVIWAMTVMAF